MSLYSDFLYTQPFIRDPSLSVVPKLDDVPQDLLSEQLDLKGYPNIKVFDFDEFVPRAYQASLFRELLSRPNLTNVFWVLPRRAGKTEIMVIYLIIRALQKAPISRAPYLKYGILYPDLASGKEAAWEKMEQRTRGLPNLKHKENDGRVIFTLNHANGKEVKVTIQIVGLQDMDKRRGRGYDGLVADECATLPHGWRKIILPMLSDEIKKPTFLVNIGTPQETGDFWEVYDQYKMKEESGDLSYHTMWLNTERLQHVDKKQWEDLKLGLSTEELAIEYGCKRGINISGRIFGEECIQVRRRGGIKEIPQDPVQRKWMVCDIGSSKRDFFAIWVFQLNYNTGMWEAIDYTQIPSADDNKIFKWVQDQGHKIGQIILPFDGERGIPCMRAVLSVKFPQAQVRCLPKVSIVDRIRYARTVFPRVCFSTFETSVGWNCLLKYSRVMKKQTGIMELTPRHDAFSHGADAFTYFATGLISGILDINLNNEHYKMRQFEDLTNRQRQAYDPMDSFMNELRGVVA